jgi:hypothetical protein
MGTDALAEPEDAEAREHRADDRGIQRGNAPRAEGDDNECHLGPLEKSGLVRDDHADPVPFGPTAALCPELGDLAPVDLLLVVQRDDACDPKDRLAQPAQAEEEKQCADEAKQ